MRPTVRAAESGRGRKHKRVDIRRSVNAGLCNMKSKQRERGYARERDKEISPSIAQCLNHGNQLALHSLTYSLTHPPLPYLTCEFLLPKNKNHFLTWQSGMTAFRMVHRSAERAPIGYRKSLKRRPWLATIMWITNGDAWPRGSWKVM